MRTLAQYLKENFEKNVIDHFIRAHVDAEGWVTLYIHPANAGGETIDFSVTGNQLNFLRTNRPTDTDPA